MSQPFDIKRLEPAGEPRSLIEQVGSFAASSNGILIWRAAEGSYTQPVWIDREGRKLAEVGEPGEYPTFDLSKDSSRLVVSRRWQSRQNLWVIDLLRGFPTRLTLAEEQHVDPRWSPDGREVIFGSTADPGRSPFRLTLSDLKSDRFSSRRRPLPSMTGHPMAATSSSILLLPSWREVGRSYGRFHSPEIKNRRWLHAH
jgi:hypothetical protein